MNKTTYSLIKTLIVIIIAISLFYTIRLTGTPPLINIKSIDPNAVLDIRYASTNNFTKQKIYSEPECYIHNDLAVPLQKIIAELATHNLRLKFYDCYRPIKAQFKLWEIVPDDRYVANPYTTGSNHNRGIALDITLINENGEELQMPTAHDDFTEKAHTTYMDLPKKVLANRALLHSIMQAHGFQLNTFEWWHFDYSNANEYPLIDTKFESLPQ